MTLIRTQHDLKRAATIPFCYLCGRSLDDGDPVNRDHVPPKAIFHVNDRSSPLILRTHESCNSAQSVADEMIGQFLSVIYGKYVSSDNLRLEIVEVSTEPQDNPEAVLTGFNLAPVVWRWVRAFHSALYQVHLPEQTKRRIHSPLPTGTHDGDGTFVMHPISPEHYQFVSTIKRNRTAACTDRVECFNGKCMYECVWVTCANNLELCVFALDVYSWKQLADAANYPARGCVGAYSPETGIPTGAAREATFTFPFENVDPLDAFAP